MLTVGVDVGGTSVRAGVVDGSGVVIDTARAPTPGTDPELEDTLAAVVGELVGRHPVAAVGLAVAGFVTADRAGVRFAPHLPWRDAPVVARMTARLGLPVVLEHDANAAAVAEHRFGAARGAGVTVLVALGTGIGGALLVDGVVYRGAHGVAPELGHLRVVPDGRPCPCGKRGCWERYCSGTALATTATELLTAPPATAAPGATSTTPAGAAPGAIPAGAGSGATAAAPAGVGSCAIPASAAPVGAERLSTTSVTAASAVESRATGGSVLAGAGVLTGCAVAAAARAGDAVALRAVAELARWLGEGLALVADVYDPDLVVIGGGVSASAELFLDAAREHYATALTGAGHRPLATLRVAHFRDDAGMIGAATLAAALH